MKLFRSKKDEKDEPPTRKVTYHISYAGMTEAWDTGVSIQSDDSLDDILRKAKSVVEDRQ